MVQMIEFDQIPPIDLVEMGERLRWARELVEPNRMRFARKMEMDHTTVRSYEIGLRSPNIAVLYRICHSLRISFDYLFYGSLSGVDGELAVLLAEQHPELRRHASGRGTSSKAATGSTSQAPTISASISV